MLAAGACGHRSVFFVCAGAMLGYLWSNGGPGLDVEIRDPVLVGLGLRAGVEWFFTDSIAFRGFVDVPVSVTRPALRIDRVEVWRAPGMFAVFGIGLMVPFGPLESVKGG